MKCTYTEQKNIEEIRLEIGKKRTTTGELSVGCPFEILNMLKTPQRINQTPTDTNGHIMDKTDMAGRVPDDQRITIYGMPYSPVPSIRYSATKA